MRIVGFGVDIVEIERIRKGLAETRLADRVFRPDEISYASRKRDPARHLAARFAGKEAVSKALGTGVRGFSFTDIEIGKERTGQPTVTLHGKAAAVAKGLGIDEVMVSLSYSRSNAVASAVALANTEPSTSPDDQGS